MKDAGVIDENVDGSKKISGSRPAWSTPSIVCSSSCQFPVDAAAQTFYARL